MATRFDTIGSQNNVQNPGEGEAYIYDRQAAPLEKLGNTAMKLHLAAQKAKEKRLVDAEKQKYDVGDTGTVGYLFHDLNTKHTLEDENYYVTNRNNPEARTQSILRLNTRKNLNYGANQFITNYDQALESVQKNPENYDIKGAETLLNDIKNKALDSYAQRSTKGFVNPNVVLSQTRAASFQDKKQLADNIGQDITSAVRENQALGGFTTNDYKRVSQAKFDAITDNSWSDNPIYKNRYNQIFRDSTENMSGDEIKKQYADFVVPPTQGLPTYTDKDGRQFSVDNNSWGKLQFKTDISGLIDNTNKERFVQKWIPDKYQKAWGIGSDKAPFKMNPSNETYIVHQAYGQDEKGNIIPNKRVDVTTNMQGGFKISPTNGKGEGIVVNTGSALLSDLSGQSPKTSLVSNAHLVVDNIKPIIYYEEKDGMKKPIPLMTKYMNDGNYDAILKEAKRLGWDVSKINVGWGAVGNEIYKDNKLADTSDDTKDDTKKKLDDGDYTVGKEKRLMYLTDDTLNDIKVGLQAKALTRESLNNSDAQFLKFQQNWKNAKRPRTASVGTPQGRVGATKGRKIPQ